MTKTQPRRFQLTTGAATAMAQAARSRRGMPGMSNRPRSQAGPPMTLGHARQWRAVARCVVQANAGRSLSAWHDGAPQKAGRPARAASG
jgi:hypothetical protein